MAFGFSIKNTVDEVTIDSLYPALLVYGTYPLELSMQIPGTQMYTYRGVSLIPESIINLDSSVVGVSMEGRYVMGGLNISGRRVTLTSIGALSVSEMQKGVTLFHEVLVGSSETYGLRAFSGDGRVLFDSGFDMVVDCRVVKLGFTASGEPAASLDGGSMSSTLDIPFVATGEPYLMFHNSYLHFRAVHPTGDGFWDTDVAFPRMVGEQLQFTWTPDFYAQDSGYVLGAQDLAVCKVF
ncbi:hypothetical protein NFC81_09060 [Salinispirillum sp. LH 10-3-1]|uniref:Uncharacterized protein n=1 Tax=Salinispirillum sp. LH 10-3-1 TaxID=2952525 RepID=A0AB38YCW6_9GAMM